MVPGVRVVVRAAAIADAAAMGRVHVLSWQAAYPKLMPQDYLDRLDVDRRADHWRQVLSRPREHAPLLVAVAGNEVVGFAGFGPVLDDPDYRRLGSSTGSTYARIGGVPASAARCSPPSTPGWMTMASAAPCCGCYPATSGPARSTSTTAGRTTAPTAPPRSSTSSCRRSATAAVCRSSGH